MQAIEFYIKPKYADYLSGHRLNNQRKDFLTSLFFILLGIALIYLGTNKEEIDKFYLIAGLFFITYSVLIRPIVFNYKIKRLWKDRYKGLSFSTDKYQFDENGMKAENENDKLCLKWEDFSGYKVNKKVLNIDIANSNNFLTLPIYHLDEKLQVTLIELVEKKIKRIPTTE